MIITSFLLYWFLPSLLTGLTLYSLTKRELWSWGTVDLTFWGFLIIVYPIGLILSLFIIWMRESDKRKSLQEDEKGAKPS